MDFTLKKYSELLNAVGHGDFQLVSGGNILRHDIDKSPSNALKMAIMEAKREIKSTYYFRVPRTFSVEIIDKIHSLDHEIGFHYEVLDKAKGNYEQAIKLFEKEWRLFRRWNAKTICMHGNPFTKWDNRYLWEKYDFKKYGVEKEAYLSIDFKKTNYITDTGRAWNDEKVSVKDKTNTKLMRINNTNQLIELLENKELKKFYILTHPCRWNDNPFSWGKELIWQNIKNIGKRMIR